MRDSLPAPWVSRLTRVAAGRHRPTKMQWEAQVECLCVGSMASKRFCEPKYQSNLTLLLRESLKLNSTPDGEKYSSALPSAS
jgi:hypothetical protein